MRHVNTMVVMAARRLRRFFLRPSLWVFVITVVAYWDETALHGAFVYDDAGSVKNNVVVNGKVPWRDVWTRDYWGTPMSEAQSHKSFRPLTTLSFRLNWILAERQRLNRGGDKDPKQTPEIDTFGFHVVNLFLHGVVTALVTEAAAFVFCGDTDSSNKQLDVIARLIAGLVFGLHPVHVEAVTNITSRGELLMSLFFLVAFMIYASNLPLDYTSTRHFSLATTICIYVLPWLCMALSVFSKEQGATTLVTLVVYDFIHNHASVNDYLCNSLFTKRNAAAIAFMRRAVILTTQSAVVAGWRYWLNGETSPDFIEAQNPAGFAKDRFTRVFSVSWVYCLYIWDAIYPSNLCPDWSGASIDLIENWNDKRIVGVIALWTFAASCLCSLFFGAPQKIMSSKLFMDTRRVVLLAFFAFLFSPFLLSSNLIVVVGLMKADRVIYLPLMGFALLEALFFKTVFFSSTITKDTSAGALDSTPTSRKYFIGYLLVMIQMALFASKLHERNIAWSSSLNLWMSSYSINKRSRHTVYNCGYELSLKQRYAEAEQVLRPIGSPRVEGPSNTFVYAMVLFNLDRCDEALVLIDDALKVVEEKRKTGGVRNTESSLSRTRSNILVAQAFCTQDMVESGQILYNAVQVDPTNDYAIDQAMKMVKRIEISKQINEQRARLGLA